MTLKISITGHRRLEDSEDVRRRISNAIKDILKANEETCFEAYSCLASGSDSIFAEEALEMNGKLKVVLPMPALEYSKDFDTNEIKLFYELLSNDIAPVTILNKKPEAANEINEAYLQAGKFVVDRCDFLIAVWDGEKSNGKGGTGDIVHYAHKIRKKIIHIKAYRSDISRLFIKYDKRAIQYKNIYEWLWKLSISSSLVAAVILAIFISFELNNHKVVLASCEFIAVVIAIGIIFFLKWGNLNRNRIAIRRSAERLRVLEKFDDSDINIGQLEDFIGLPDEVKKIEKKYQVCTCVQNNFEKSKKSLLHLVDEQIEYHTKNRPEIKGITFHLLERIQFPLLILFFFGVSFHFGSLLIVNEHLTHIFHGIGFMLSLCMPPIYAAIEGYIYFKEYHKISLDSDKMRSFFNSMKEAISTLDDNSSKNFEELNSFAYQIMKNMDAETKDWGIIVGQKESPGI